MRTTTEIFMERSIKAHQDKFDYSNIVYKDCKTKVAIYCKAHDIHFEQRPENHWNGAGCPQCRKEKTAEKLHSLFKFSTEDFIRKAKDIHGDKYTYDKVKYTLNAVPVVITCPTHGDFEQRPNDHTSGKKGCSLCSKTGFDKNKPATLYYLSVNNGQAFKIGITNRSVFSRFNNCDLEKIKIIKEWEYPLGKYAYKAEQAIIKLYKEYKYEGTPLLETGNSELFKIDVLGLAEI